MPPDIHALPDDVLDGIEDALTCPSCAADLSLDATFLTWRVCGRCGRHFSMPATERALRLVDDGTFHALRDMPETMEQVADFQTSALDRLAGVHERSVLQEAIVTGTGAVDGQPVVLIVLDDQLVGTHLGALAAEKVILALEHAQTRRLPVIAVTAGGTTSFHSGPLAIAQSVRIAAIASQVQALGIPMIGIVTHPTSAGVFGTLASLCDLVFAESGASVGVSWTPQRPLDALRDACNEADLLEHGWLDGVLSRPQTREMLTDVLHLIARKESVTAETPVPMPTSLDRPLTDYLAAVLCPFVELRGDRVERDDRGVIAGIGSLAGRPVAIVVQDRNHPSDASAALRKMQRLARLAGRFELPLILMADGGAVEEPLHVTPGESFAAAKLSAMMAVLPVPVISIGGGSVHGPVANIMMTGDRRAMMAGATWRAPSAAGAPGWPERGLQSDWTAKECLRLGLIDAVIAEPAGGAWDDPWKAMRMLQDDLSVILTGFVGVGPRKLAEMRARRNRELGQSEEGIAAAVGEFREWQDVQQSLSRSLDDWRERIEQRVGTGEWRDRLEQRGPIIGFSRPDLGDLAARLKTRQEALRQELRERTGRSDERDE